MANVFMPKPGEDWVCDVIIDEFRSATTHRVVDLMHEADVVWHYAKWVAGHHHNVPKGITGHKPTITTVHHIVPDKFRSGDIAHLDAFTDIYHVPNDITMRELSRHTRVPIVVVPYWINDAKFRRREPRQVGSVVTIGSFQRDTEGAGIAQGQFVPKLEKGPDILAEVLSRLDPKRYRVLLAGWRRQYIIGRLRAMGMPFDYHERAPDVVPLYNDCDFYLVTSRYEGGPQALLECAQTGVMVLSTPVGLAPQLLHPDCICTSVNDFVQRLNSRADRTDENFQNVQGYGLGAMIGRYDALIREAHGAKV